MKSKGEILQSGIYVCEIFIESMFKDFYYASLIKKEIIGLIDYMYVQSEEKLTTYANKICDEFAKQGQYFLRELYEKYNP